MTQSLEDEVRRRIENWLTEEGFTLNSNIKTQRKRRFVIAFKEPQQQGATYYVAQEEDKKDLIQIIMLVAMGEPHMKMLQEMEDSARSEFLWELRFDLLRSGCVFSFDNMELPRQIEIDYPIYYDALSKDKFMEGYRRVKMTALLVIWRTRQLLGESPSQVSEPSSSLFA
jgi:hypothetical protein